MMFKASLTLCLIVFAFLQGCVLGNERIGMTLLFLNKGHYGIGVTRFDPDGQRGPVPGALGPGAGIKDAEHGKQMMFMPGDSKRGIPQFVEVEWMVATPEIEQLRAKRDQQFQIYSSPWMNETDRINANTPRYTRVIDLTPILTPELLAQVRANRSSTNLKLTVVFQGDNVSITAAPHVWRK